MTFPIRQRRTFALLSVLLLLAALLIWVALRSGPMAPVAITQARVQTQALHPALFGIGTVQARHSIALGSTVAARIRRLHVDVGDAVQAGQVLGEFDPVDLDDRLRAQQAARQRAQASLREAQARQAFAATQERRYTELLAARSTSEETLATKRQERVVADAALAAAREDLTRVEAELSGLRAVRAQWQLVAPADGIVTARNAEPGSTVVAGQTVLELIDPASLWIDLRLDQASATGLARDLPARITLRSGGGAMLAGRVLRIEPKADAVTEELLAKVVFTQAPTTLPPLGELAEVTIDLPALASTPVLPNAALQRQSGHTGVWQVREGRVRFVPIKTGRSDLDGRVQVLQGLAEGDQIVVYSEKPLSAGTRVHVVPQIAGAAS